MMMMMMTFPSVCVVLPRLRESWRRDDELDGVRGSNCARPLWRHRISSSALSLAAQRTTVTYWELAATLRGQNNSLGLAVSLCTHLCWMHQWKTTGKWLTKCQSWKNDRIGRKPEGPDGFSPPDHIFFQHCNLARHFSVLRYQRHQ